MSMFHTASMFQTKHVVHLKQATVIGWKTLVQENIVGIMFNWKEKHIHCTPAGFGLKKNKDLGTFILH